MRTLALAIVALASACVQPTALLDTPSGAPAIQRRLDVGDPAEPGPYRVAHFVYGSGTDRRRSVFRDSVRVRTMPVNGAVFLRGLPDRDARRRWRWWGFSARELPVNARVWYPEGPGAFPLVLIVHGNHDMREFSDPGYEYLGRHLASRGYIVASVDENFLNGDISDENDARGWMLLQHLVAWRSMAADTASPVRGRVDLSRIALIGHSRGGEAVAVAAAFNRLRHHPDDARVRFDFGFDIRTIIALAPVDGQYLPMDRRVPVRDVNYLVMHGSHDADVTSFSGQRTFFRASTADPRTVKASVFVYRANHGQWNTVWGDNDVGAFGFLLRRQSLLSGDAQRRVGKVYVTGFLDLTLRDERRLEAMFRDYRFAAPWLPATRYVSAFASQDDHHLATFDEDIDVTTGTAAQVRIETTGLALWREELLPVRSGGGTFGNGVALLGWRRTDGQPPAAYRITLGASDIRDDRADDAALVFRMMDLRRVPTPLAAADTAAVRPGTAPTTRDAREQDRLPAIPEDSALADLTVALELTDGRRASLPLSSVVTPEPPLTAHLFRYRWAERRALGDANDFEYVLQRVEIPLARFRETLPDIALAKIRAIEFRFDRTAAGTIYLDDVGFTGGQGGGR
jgi:dienelactone hydrolase